MSTYFIILFNAVAIHQVHILGISIAMIVETSKSGRSNFIQSWIDTRFEFTFDITFALLNGNEKKQSQKSQVFHGFPLAAAIDPNLAF